jgi:hypothetical protein
LVEWVGFLTGGFVLKPELMAGVLMFEGDLFPEVVAVLFVGGWVEVERAGGVQGGQRDGKGGQGWAWVDGRLELVLGEEEAEQVVVGEADQPQAGGGGLGLGGAGVVD